MPESLFNFIKKETLAQVFSSEFCEISKNTFLHRTPMVAVSENKKNVSPNKCLLLNFNIYYEAIYQVTI